MKQLGEKNLAWLVTFACLTASINLKAQSIRIDAPHGEPRYTITTHNNAHIQIDPAAKIHRIRTSSGIKITLTNMSSGYLLTFKLERVGEFAIAFKEQGIFPIQGEWVRKEDQLLIVKDQNIAFQLTKPLRFTESTWGVLSLPDDTCIILIKNQEKPKEEYIAIADYEAGMLELSPQLTCENLDSRIMCAFWNSGPLKCYDILLVEPEENLIHTFTTKSGKGCWLVKHIEHTEYVGDPKGKKEEFLLDRAHFFSWAKGVARLRENSSFKSRL